MQKHVIFGIFGLLIGLAIGFVVANSINRSAVSEASPAAVMQQNAPFVAESGQGQNPQGGMMPDVAEALDKAKSEPENFEAQMKAGEMYAQIGKNETAIEFLANGVKLKPNDFDANIALANSYFDLRQFENAETYYSKALEIDPKNINARTDLGTTFVERSNPDIDRGIKEFQEALALDPKHEPTLYNLGIAYIRKGDAASAESTIAKLEQANPNSQLLAKLRQNKPAK
jgi:tetratricopeptide (TPR) repeat protein